MRPGVTYNLAFFFGPGFPRGLGSPSGPNATPELRFTPFFFGPSSGGGISEGTGVPLGIGVLVADSTGLSVDVMGAAMGIVLERVEVESFDGESSLISLTSCLMGAAGSRLCKNLGDSLKVRIFCSLPFDDFRRAVEAVVGLLDGAIRKVDGCFWWMEVMKEEGDRVGMKWFRRQQVCVFTNRRKAGFVYNPR